MKEKKRWLKPLQGGLEWLCFFPLFYLFGLYFIPEHLLWPWLLSFLIVYPILIALFIVLKSFKKHWLVWVVLSVGTAGISFLLFEPLWLVVVILITQMIWYYRAYLNVNQEWRQVFPFPIFWFSLFLYFTLYLFLNYFDRLFPVYFLLWFIVFVVALMISNEALLHLMTNQRKSSVSLKVKGVNFIFLLASLSVAAIIVFVEPIKHALMVLFNVIVYGIVWLFGLFLVVSVFIIGELFMLLPDSDFKINLDNERRGGLEEGVGRQIEENPWLQKIAFTVLIILLVAALLWILYIIIKRILLLRKSLEDEEEYYDERESIFDFKDLKKDYQLKVNDWFQNLLNRNKRWGELQTNAERIRFIYRLVLAGHVKQGYRLKRAYTPLETRDDLLNTGVESEPNMAQLTQLYVQARYSQEVIEDAQVEQIKPEALK
jgi:hypothetical protein